MAGIEICRLVWGSLELLKKTSQDVPATPKPHPKINRNQDNKISTSFSAQNACRRTRTKIYAVQGYSSSRVLAGPPSPHRVPLSQSASWSIRQGIVTIPGLGRPSRRPLPSGAMTSPQGRPEMQSGVEQCLVHAMPKQQTFCVLKHFIATTKTATSPESPTVTNP